jgi:hypothetical protein
VTDEANRGHVWLVGQQVVFKLSQVSICESCGLFISAIVLDEDGIPVSRADCIQLSGKEEGVTIRNIFHLRAIFPETIRRAVEDIRQASNIWEQDYERICSRIPTETEAE